MNYIYDILVNFCEKPYEFYDWNLDDEIEHIRKIPLFRVSSVVLRELKEYRIVVREEMMEKIKNKAEVFARKGTEVIPYACLFSDEMEVIGIEFNHQGVTIAKTKLSIDEEDEVLEVVSRIPECKICYTLIEKEKIEYFKTRKEEEILSYIEMELASLKNDQVQKLQYLYYECFNKKEKNVNKILKQIKLALKENFNDTYPQIYQFFKLIDTKKQKLSTGNLDG